MRTKRNFLNYLFKWTKLLRDLCNNNSGRVLAILIPFTIIISLFIRGAIAPLLLLKNFLNPLNGKIVLAVILVQVFSKSIKKADYHVKLQKVLKMLTTHKILTIPIPSALFGLLPMPAGALVSAPFTEQLGKEIELSNDKIFFVNYWFRHIWEYSWPLYAGVILGAGILKIPIYKFSFLQFPFVVLMAFVGLLFLFLWTKGVKERYHAERERISVALIVELFLPLLVLFFLTLVLKVNVNISLVISLVLISFLSEIPIIFQIKAFFKSILSFTTILIIMVLLLKTGIRTSHLLDSLFTGKLSGMGPAYIGGVIAFVSGFFTGITQAAIGIAFPMIEKYLTANKNAIPFVYTMGFMGVMVSPFHLCYLTSKEYFNVPTVRTYIYILPSVLLMISFAVLYLML